MGGLRDWCIATMRRGCTTSRAAIGPPPRLSSEQQVKVADRLEQGPDFERDGVARWRGVDLQKRIAPIATTAGSPV